MSHEKFAAGTPNVGEPAKIRFFYPTDSVFNSVSLRSTYRANMTKTADGESQLDDVAISQDEKDIMKEFMAEAVYDVAAELFKITEGITLSVFVDSQITLAAGIGTPTNAATQPSSPVSNALYAVTTAWGGFAVGTIVKYVGTTFVNVSPVASGFEIRDNAAFNANLLPSLDKKIENCIRYAILREWYASTGMLNDMKINADMAKANMQKVKNLTFQLRKPLMS